MHFKLKNFIRKYPYWYYSILSGGFIFIFLVVFKPFGFQEVPGEILNPLLWGYGLVGFLLVLLNHMVFGNLVNRYFPDKGSLVRVWIWPMWIILTVILVNVVFTRWYFVKTGLSTPVDFQSWPVIVGTLAIGILCIFIIEIIDQNIRFSSRSLSLVTNPVYPSQNPFTHVHGGLYNVGGAATTSAPGG